MGGLGGGGGEQGETTTITISGSMHSRTGGSGGGGGGNIARTRLGRINTSPGGTPDSFAPIIGNAGSSNGGIRTPNGGTGQRLIATEEISGLSQGDSFTITIGEGGHGGFSGEDAYNHLGDAPGLGPQANQGMNACIILEPK